MSPLRVCWPGSLLCRLAASAPHWGPPQGPPRALAVWQMVPPAPRIQEGRKEESPKGSTPRPQKGEDRRRPRLQPDSRAPVQRLKALLWRASTWLPRPYMNQALNSEPSLYPGRTSSFISISWFESKKKSRCKVTILAKWELIQVLQSWKLNDCSFSETYVKLVAH